MHVMYVHCTHISIAQHHNLNTQTHTELRISDKKTNKIQSYTCNTSSPCFEKLVWLWDLFTLIHIWLESESPKSKRRHFVLGFCILRSSTLANKIILGLESDAMYYVYIVLLVYSFNFQLPSCHGSKFSSFRFGFQCSDLCMGVCTENKSRKLVSCA